jgi:predicted RNase H-like nuclease (RuvC/YqgF family)
VPSPFASPPEDSLRKTHSYVFSSVLSTTAPQKPPNQTHPSQKFIPTRYLAHPVSTRTRALDTVIFGVDIQSGDVRGDAPAYALVTFDGENLDRDVVSLRKLRRLIAREEPAIVATDNMYELAADKDALVHFLRELPSETRLVQVTGDERPEPLSRVASRHGVPYAKEPMAEAEAAARLAAMNVGFEVTAFTNTTQVKVSRGRSTGKGGWSQDRYTRRIHGNVRRAAREVRDDLDEAGLDYEMDVTEKYGGYSQALFRVEGRPADIPVSARRSGDIRIEIEREKRDGIEFHPLAKRRDHVIVGIDPGTTTAVALLDLDGKLLDVLSTRTADTAEVIEWIIERGRPVLVAADVTPMPETVEKFRRSFDAAGWTPENDLPVDGKQHRTREHGYDNDHERDAMAAALYAFDAHADQFARIARKVPAQLDRGEVTARVVAGGQSVEAVLRELADDPEPEEERTEHEVRELTPEERKIKRLTARIDRLEDHVADLKETIRSKDDRLAEFKRELSDARREERKEARERREITRLERENSRLKRELADEREATASLDSKLERLKTLWRLDHSNFADVAAEKQGLVPVKPIEQFTRAAIEDAQARFGLAEDDVILLRDASGAGTATAELLADIEPRVVLRHGNLSEQADRVLFEHGIPVGPAGEVTVQEVDELAITKEEEVQAVIDAWHERAAGRKKDQNAAMVDRLISEHRAEGGRASDGTD